MAGRMALNLGKGAFQKMGNKNNQDPTPTSVDHAHYRGAKVKKDLSLDDHKIANDHRKDSAYYEYMGIPKKDARILSAVVTSARFLDTNGINLGFYKLGANTIFGLIPEAGDFIGSTLSLVLVVVPVWRISKGPGKKKVKWIVLGNLGSSFVIGLLPWLGDYINTKRKCNVKSASMLEAMLLKRADEVRSLGPDAEKVVGRMNGHQRAGTNGHSHTAATNTYHDSDPPIHQSQRYGNQRAGTNGHLHTAATNTHHDSDPPTHQPQRYITANDLRQDPKPTQPKNKSGGNFFRRREGGEPQGRPEIVEVAPGRPPRPNQRDGYF